MYRFNPMPTNVSLEIMKTGNSAMDIPTFIRPYMFDFTNQQRRFTVNATLIASTYVPDVPGTGSILDQIEDLLYIVSANWVGRALSGGNAGENFLRMFVPYPTAMSTTHSPSMTDMYTESSTSPSVNADSTLDVVSVPDDAVSPYGGYSRLLTDKVYYVYPDGMSIPRDAASVNRVNITLQLVEVQEVIKI